ncbi:MAG: hypothetical protein HY005_01480 [Candidatus Staskawiczbacteria bacterium]|nr:hypothetical protein [Candidatus Staskawiczbacteria bacterium]MBI3337279.1 hypothetical protein [Candidatus Staskawiczbacteria bacterium]
MINNKKTESPESQRRAWVVAADMGYGHQRTAYPLRDLAFSGKVINANSYDGIPEKDRRFWHATKSLYEFISRFKRIPLIGNIIFSFLDKFQRILSYYPKRDLSRPDSNIKVIFSFIKKGWGEDLILRFKKNHLPIISTFFTPAFMAEHFQYPNDIYCVVCDADIARVWASLDPKKSKIKYFAPCTWVRDRLKLYGVDPQKIFLTGYPLPKENIGKDMEILKEDLRNRIINLDPKLKYRQLYKPLIQGYLGDLPKKSDHPLTIMFSIGGAGAQKEIGLKAVNSLKDKIKNNKLRIIIAVGTRIELTKYFTDNVRGLKLDGWVHILSAKTTKEYFEKFNQALRETDVLWTKPSELSFYAGLGIPIIIAPSIGSQEDFNKRWLLHIGAGTPQENPKYIDQWFFDLLNTGDFAEIAMQGFIEIEKLGTYNIEKIIESKNE